MILSHIWHSRSYHIDFSSCCKCQHAEPGGGSTKSHSLKIKQYTKPINPTLILRTRSRYPFKPLQSWTARLRTFLLPWAVTQSLPQKRVIEAFLLQGVMGIEIRTHSLQTFSWLAKKIKINSIIFSNCIPFIPFILHLYVITVKPVPLFRLTWFSFIVIQSMSECNYVMNKWETASTFRINLVAILFCNDMTMWALKKEKLQQINMSIMKANIWMHVTTWNKDLDFENWMQRFSKNMENFFFYLMGKRGTWTWDLNPNSISLLLFPFLTF